MIRRSSVLLEAHKAVLRERRACLRIAKEYYDNEVKWRETYEKNGPKAMYHNSQGGCAAAWEIMQRIRDRTKARKR